MSEVYITVDIEKADISTTFNAFVLQVFLMGVYIMIYTGTMYTYNARNSSNHRIVPATITIQCVCSVIYTGMQWYQAKWEFIDNGGTRDSVFLSLYTGPQWLYFGGTTAIYIVLVLADGLLIWRCFFIWGRSFRVILVPLLLLVAEIGLFLAQPVMHAIHNNPIVSEAFSNMFNDLVAAAYFTTFATSLITTTLIAYRIYAFSGQIGSSRKKFKHILDIVVQSGAVYSFTVLATAISGVLPGGANVDSTQTIAVQTYIQSIGIYVAGMSATIMVARVGLLSTDTAFPSTAHFSDLQFHAPTTHQANVEGVDVGNMTFAEGEKAGSEVH